MCTWVQCLQNPDVMACCGCWEQILGPLEGERVLLAAEPSLQALVEDTEPQVYCCFLYSSVFLLRVS